MTERSRLKKQPIPADYQLKHFSLEQRDELKMLINHYAVELVEEVDALYEALCLRVSKTRYRPVEVIVYTFVTALVGGVAAASIPLLIK